jgi:hypothetical protein
LPNFVPYTRHQLKAVLGEIQASIYTSLVPLEITAWRTAEPVSFSERFSGLELHLSIGDRPQDRVLAGGAGRALL